MGSDYAIQESTVALIGGHGVRVSSPLGDYKC